MSSAFSIYLEIARLVATMIVFIGHSKIFYDPLDKVCEVLKPGRDGVIIFFILSGYIISWCADKSDRSVTAFAINRASRIYSVALPAIFIGYAASLIISAYLNEPLAYQFNKPWIYLPIHISFIGNFWLLSEVPPTNFPYWSLNYEVWYYVIFAAFFFPKTPSKWLLIAILIFLAGPNLLLMFPLWIAGSAFYFHRDQIHISTRFARVLILTTLSLFVLVKYFHTNEYFDQFNAVLLPARYVDSTRFLGDLLLGLIVLLNLIGAHYASLNFGETFSRRIRYVASFSFSFYLFHEPIFELIKNTFQPDTSSLFSYFIILSISALMIVILAHFSEHKKHVYRNLLSSLTNRLSLAKRAP